MCSTSSTMLLRSEFATELSVCVRASRDAMTEDETLEALERETRRLNPSPSAIAFKTAMEVTTRMNSMVTVAKGVHDIITSVSDTISRTGWRSAVR